jgi:hypothetical protein
MNFHTLLTLRHHHILYVSFICGNTWEKTLAGLLPTPDICHFAGAFIQSDLQYTTPQIVFSTSDFQEITLIKFGKTL